MNVRGDTRRRAWARRVRRTGSGLVILAFAFLRPHAAVAEESLRLDDHPPFRAPSLGILTDPTGALGIEAVRRASFRRSRTPAPSFGFTPGAVWVRLDISNASARRDWRIAVSSARIEDLRFFYERADGRTAEIRTGSGLRFEERPYKHRDFVFPIDIAPGAKTSIYFRAASQTSIQLPIEVWTPESLHDHEVEEMLLFGGLFGAHLLLFFYNLAIGVFLRSRAFLLYAAFVLVATAFYCSTYGFSYRYFWPDWPVFNRNVNLVLLTLVVAVGLSFARTLLGTARTPRADLFLRGYIVVTLCSVVLLLFVSYRAAAQINIALAVGAFVPIAFALFRGVREGEGTALYFAAAMSCYALGAFVFAALGFGWLPAIAPVRFSFLVGATAAAAILSLAVATAVRTLAIDREAALAAENFKSRFLWVMSHEIRTPLTAVVGMTDLLAGARDEAEREHFLGILRESGARLAHLVNQVLDYARIEQGKIDLGAAPFRLSDVIDGAVLLFRPAAERKGVALVVVSAVDHLTVVGDAARISQILLNLIGNAVKFTHEGTITVRASVDPLGESSMHVHFAVEDTGVGIPADQRDLIFQGFVQAETSGGSRPEGTGLGLAIVAELVQVMQGSIRVEDHPSGGSVFLVSLPLGAPEDVHTLQPPQAAAAAQGARSLRVLVAEDDEHSALLVRTILTRQGHDVELHGNGLQAVVAVTTRSFDLVLLDIQMPEMDGLTAARRMRALPAPASTIPIYALSANALPQDLAACRAAGFTGHIAKPYRAADLHMLMNAIAAGKPASVDF